MTRIKTDNREHGRRDVRCEDFVYVYVNGNVYGEKTGQPAPGTDAETAPRGSD